MTWTGIRLSSGNPKKCGDSIPIPLFLATTRYSAVANKIQQNTVTVYSFPILLATNALTGPQFKMNSLMYHDDVPQPNQHRYAGIQPDVTREPSAP
jgi:hypothetical protein